MGNAANIKAAVWIRLSNLGLWKGKISRDIFLKTTDRRRKSGREACWSGLTRSYLNRIRLRRPVDPVSPRSFSAGNVHTPAEVYTPSSWYCIGFVFFLGARKCKGLDLYLPCVWCSREFWKPPQLLDKSPLLWTSFLNNTTHRTHTLKNLGVCSELRRWVLRALGHQAKHMSSKTVWLSLLGQPHDQRVSCGCWGCLSGESWWRQKGKHEMLEQTR